MEVLNKMKYNLRVYLCTQVINSWYFLIDREILSQEKRTLTANVAAV